MNRSFLALRTCAISGAGGARQVWRGLEARLLIFPAFLGGVTVETRETPRGGTRAAVALRAQRSERQITQLRRSSLPPSLLPPSLPAGSIPPSLPPSAAAPMEAGAGDGGRGMVGGVPAPLLFPPSPSPAYRPLSPFPSRSLSPALPPLRAAGPAQVSREGAPGVRSGGLGTGGAACAGGIERQRVLGEGSAPGLQHSPWHTPDTRHACSSPALHAAAPHCTHLHCAHRAATRALEPYCMTGSLQWESHILWSPALQCTPTPCTRLALDASYPYDMRHTRMACTRTPLHAPNPPSMHQNPTGHISPILRAPALHYMHWTCPACMHQTLLACPRPTSAPCRAQLCLPALWSTAGAGAAVQLRFDYLMA